MRAYFNMPTNEFVAQLRDIAIKASARPQVIDAIDAIWDAPSEEEIADRISDKVAETEISAFQDGRAEMWDACSSALDSILFELELDMGDKQALRAALKEVKP